MLVSGIAGGSAAAAPPLVEQPRPFEQGAIDLGLAFGFSSGGGRTAFGLGANFGYFVLPGLEPGVQLDVTFGADRPTVTQLLPYLRWIVWRSYRASPYLKAQGGRLFISGGHQDLSAVGGGGGLVLFLSPRVGLQLEAVVLRLFPAAACADACTVTDWGLSLGFFWSPGRSGRRAAASPAPPPEPGEPQ